MQTLALLFGRSPFAPLQAHMNKVAECVRDVIPLFEALEAGDAVLVAKIAERIAHHEHQADLAKNDIRNHLSGGLFLPVAKALILEVLSLQDTLADQAEDVGVLLTLQTLEFPARLKDVLWPFIRKNQEAFEGAYAIIQEMGGLLESSFGGLEAERVQKMVTRVGHKEHEADLLQRTLLQVLFSIPETKEARTFFLWMQIVQELACISDVSEKLANRVRMMLEVK